jgi:hypothetical protein
MLAQNPAGSLSPASFAQVSASLLPVLVAEAL